MRRRISSRSDGIAGGAATGSPKLSCAMTRSSTGCSLWGITSRSSGDWPASRPRSSHHHASTTASRGATRGVAFREVARRHGDFAIVAVAVVADGDRSVRLGVGGVAERPAVRRIAAGGAAELREAVEAFAGELEGYEDIHATPRMRRDLLRRIGPLVIEEALRCAA